MFEKKNGIKQKKKLLAVLCGTELFGRERENIECYKTIRTLGWDVDVFGSYREKDGGAVGIELSRQQLLAGLLPFGSHFALSYFRTIKGYWKRQIHRIYSCSRIIRKHINQQHPQALMLGSHTEYLYLWPLLSFNRIQVIYRVGDGPIWDSPFHRYAMKRALKRANQIAPVSHFIAEELYKLAPKCKSKTTVIWNIPPAFNANFPVRIDNNINQKPHLRIVYVGQMTEKKGVDILIEALLQLKETIQFQCRIVGGGQFTEAFEKKLKQQVVDFDLDDSITFTGRVDDPTPHYTWANLHVAPSVYEEPFGLVIVEAKRAGVPSIVFPRGGMPELVQHDVNGWVCEYATANSLSEAIAICNQKPLRQWGSEAKKDQECNFGEYRFQQDWNQLLEKL